MKKELYDFHKNQQFKHWWFLGRNKIIDSFLKLYFKKSNPSKILDLGSGFGVSIPVLKNFGSVDALEPYMESHQELIALGAEEVFKHKNFPFEYPNKKYDLVTMFDVLEHIDKDATTLQVIHRNLLNQHGTLLITVPAYMWLWTNHDVQNMHFRRYNKAQISKLLHEAGYKNIRISYFMTLLFPIALMERVIYKLSKSSKKDINSVHPVLNKIFKFIFYLEAHIITWFSFPFGLSIIAKANK